MTGTETAPTQVIQEAYACFGRGDIAGILDRVTDDVVWTVIPIDGVPYSGTRHGKTGVADFFRLQAESEETTRFEPLEFIANSDGVAVVGACTATVRSTGRSYEADWVHIFTMRDGKIATFREFPDSASVMQAFAG